MPFVVLRRYKKGLWHLNGGAKHPTIYKTYRNARGKESPEFQRSRGVDHRIFWFDVKYLPEVIDEPDIAPLHIDHMTEKEHAERQVVLWANRVMELEAQEGPPAPLDMETHQEAVRHEIKEIPSGENIIIGGTR